MPLTESDSSSNIALNKSGSPPRPGTIDASRLELGGTVMASKPCVPVFAVSLALACCFAAGSFVEQARSTEQAAFTESIKAQLHERTAGIVAKSCSVPGCHSGQYPKAKLLLEPETFAAAVENVPSREIDSLKLVDMKRPEMSYLIMKVRGSEGIKGHRMPLEAAALPEEEIRTLELWVYTVAILEKGAAPMPTPDVGKSGPQPKR
jgi:hypothetical protein